jgi:hypothetical protein
LGFRFFAKVGCIGRNEKLGDVAQRLVAVAQVAEGAGLAMEPAELHVDGEGAPATDTPRSGGSMAKCETGRGGL